MHYFVTGATGFLGGYVSSRLLAGGHDVTALVRSREQAHAIAEHGVRPHIGSILDLRVMREGMRRSDGVFHLAGYGMALGSRRATERAVVTGTRNVLQGVRDLEIPKVVYASTISVLGDTRGVVAKDPMRRIGTLVTEDARIRARVLAGVVDPMVAAGVPAVVLLSGIVYGPGDRSGFSALLGRYLMGRVPFISTGPEFCWAHVEDVAAVHVAAMTMARPGRRYVAGGPRHSLREALAVAGRAVGKRRPPWPVPAFIAWPGALLLRAGAAVVPPLRPAADRMRIAAGVTHLADDSEARARLSFRPRPLREGLPDAVRWQLQRLFETAR